MNYCTRCVMPDTKPDLHFNEAGVCDACQSQDRKDNEIDWQERKESFEELLASTAGQGNSGYDCIVPVSGGKDSWYQAIMAKEYGLNCLLVSFEPTYATELGKRNLANLGKLGFDIIQVRKNPVVYRKMNQIAFARVGDHDWPNHVGIFTIPVQFAVRFNIPLILWGENSQLEYGGPLRSTESQTLNRRWLEEFGGLLGYRVTDMLQEGIEMKDLNPYLYPSDEQLSKAGVKGAFLGYYFKWNAAKQLEIIQQHGFETKSDGPVEGTYTNYENLDCAFTIIHDYLKYVKFGFGRATDHACLDIRNNRISREKAIELVTKYEGFVSEESINLFCNYMKLTSKEYHKIVDSFTNRHVFETDENRKFKRDQLGRLVKKYPVVATTSTSTSHYVSHH